MNFEDFVVKDSPGLCRCCLSEGCYKDLGTEYNWMNENEVYADMLLDCFDIGITQHNDGPNGAKRLICEVCITRLRDACNFKKQVLDSEKKFIDMLGRGEFKPKVVLYQKPMKAETIDTNVEDIFPSEVEFLEDVEYTDSEEVIKAEDTESMLPTTSEDAASTAKPKKGRPKKQDAVARKTKPKMAKVVKEYEVEIDDLSVCQRKEELAKLFKTIIENSTVMPFRWYCSKFMCFYCGCPFTESNLLKQHNESEHSDTKIRSVLHSILKTNKVKLEISQINCKLCSQEFPKLYPLIDHLQDVHNLATSPLVRTELFAYKLADDKMTCEECGEQFRFFATLLKHYHASHNKNMPFICEICGMGFVAKCNVAAHVRNVHDRAGRCQKCDKKDCEHKSMKKLKCNKCSEVLPSTYLKKRHMAAVHGVNDVAFACDLCPQAFPVRSRLVAHKLRVHLKQRTFSCEVCGYRAFNKDHLRKHMVSHTDERPFECEFCKKTFQRKKTLEFHRRIHTNDRRYVCKECGKAYVQTASLKLHYRVHHPKENTQESWA